MNSVTSDKISVKIYGKDYELDPGGLTPLEASRLATYVDEKMQEISEKLRIVDTGKVAVLAALNIALDLSQAHETDTRLAAGSERKIDEMIRILDEALGK